MPTPSEDRRPRLDVLWERAGDGLVLRVFGDVDAGTEHELMAHVDAVLDRTTGRDGLLLDLSGVAFLAVGGVTAFLDLALRAHRAGCPVVVLAPPGCRARHVLDLLEHLHIPDPTFHLADTADEAAARLAGVPLELLPVEGRPADGASSEHTEASDHPGIG